MNTTVAENDVTGAIQPTPATRWALTGLSLAMLLSSLGTSIANVGLPTLAQAFAATFQEVQWVVLAYLLAVTSLIVSIGRLGDLFGRRRLLLGGIFLFTSASVLCGLAPSLPLLIVSRAVQGLGAAAMMALTLTFVSEILPKAQTGRAMGLLGTMSAVGTALGPSLGGVLIAAFDWPALFLINIPLGIAAFLLTRHSLPADTPDARAERASFDGVGTLLLAFALAVYALAMTIGRGHFGLVNVALLIGAAGVTALFVVYQSWANAPLVRLSLLRDRGLSGALLTSSLVATVMMTTLVVGPYYLSLALGLKPAAVGLALSMGPLVAALTSVPAGRMADRVGAHCVTVIGLLGIASGSTMLALLPASLGTPGYLGPIIVITVGYAMFQTANNTVVMRDVPKDQRGVVSGLLNLSRNLGFITGASLMGAIFAFASKTTDITTASPVSLAAGMRVTFAAAATLIIVALAIASGSRVRTSHTRPRSELPA